MTEMLATNKQFYICLKSQEQKLFLDILCTHTYLKRLHCLLETVTCNVHMFACSSFR